MHPTLLSYAISGAKAAVAGVFGYKALSSFGVLAAATEALGLDGGVNMNLISDG